MAKRITKKELLDLEEYVKIIRKKYGDERKSTFDNSLGKYSKGGVRR